MRVLPLLLLASQLSDNLLQFLVLALQILVVTLQFKIEMPLDLSAVVVDADYSLSVAMQVHRFNNCLITA